MAKAPSKYPLSVKLDVETRSVTITQFERDEDGDGKTEIGSRTYCHDDLPPDSTGTMTSLYGDSKILQDRTSGESSSRSRLDSMDEVWARLKEGAWQKERESRGQVVSVEVEALAQLKGVSVADIQRSLGNYTAEQREQVLGHEKVKEIADKLRQERQAAADAPVTDLGDLLGDEAA